MVKPEACIARRAARKSEPAIAALQTAATQHSRRKVV
jgi:hypothetical protein